MDPLTSFAASVVQTGSTIIGSTATPKTIKLAAGEGAQFPGGDGTTQFYVVGGPAGVPFDAANAAQVEYVRVTRSGDTLTTASRGQLGTTALATWAASWRVMAAITPQHFTDVTNQLSVTAATIGALGTGLDGKIVLLRAGGTPPFTFKQATYDATFGKWVTETDRYPLSGGFNMTTSFAVIAGAFVEGVKALYDAGLRINTRFITSYFLNNATSRTLSIQIALIEQGDDDTALGTDRYVSATWAKTKATTGVLLWAGAWDATAYASPPAKAEGALVLRAKADTDPSNAVFTGSGTGWVGNVASSMFVRWTG